ncbi:MAG: DUF805 domain-containing protein [Verrucomicrobiales bacterium]
MTSRSGFFSFQGRIGRKSFWLTYLSLIGLMVVLMGGATLLQEMMQPDVSQLSEDEQFERAMAGEGGPGFPIALLVAAILYIPLVWAALALQVKRLHDRALSGWCVLIGLVPLLNIWLLVQVGFLKGTEGPNKYGSDPLV